MTTDAATLARVTAVHPLRGLGGMLGMELRIWFPWRWLMLSVASGGVFALVYVPWTLSGVNQLGSLIYTFCGMWIALLFISVVSLTEGAVLGEIEGGTAAWLAAMPIARPAILVAKFVAAVAGIAAVVFTVGLASYPVLSAASKQGVTEFNVRELMEIVSSPVGMWGRFTTLADPGEWTVMLAAVATLLGFVIAVMMLLGTVLRSRAIVFGLGLVVVGVFGAAAFAGSFAELSPGGLIGAIADSLLAEPADFAVPLLATWAWTIGVLLVAVWRFGRRELQ